MKIQRLAKRTEFINGTYLFRLDFWRSSNKFETGFSRETLHTYDIFSIFSAMSHAIIESKTHVGWQNEITRANVDPRHPRVFRGLQSRSAETFRINYLTFTAKSRNNKNALLVTTNINSYSSFGQILLGMNIKHEIIKVVASSEQTF